MRCLRVLLVAALTAATLAVVPASAAEAAVAPAVSGVLTRDLNANDALDAGEPPLAGVGVVLRDVAGLVAAGPVTTGADGSYIFESLLPGAYRVAIDSPLNYLVSGPSADNSFTPTGDQTTGTTDLLVIGPSDDLVANGLIRPRPELSVGYFAVGQEDGSSPFTSAGSCAGLTDPQIDGQDCGSDNGVIRSADSLSISVSLTADNYEPGAPNLQNVIYEQTITPGPGAEVNFERIPAVCSGTNPASTIVTNPDGSITLSCNVGAMAEGGAKTFTTSIIPSADSTNGSTFEVTQRVYSLDDDGIENAVPDELISDFDEYTISSAPAYDVIKNRFHNQDVVSREINGETLTGYRTYFTFGIAADRELGVEQLEQPITITDSITAVGADGVSAVPGFEYYMLECIPNPTVWAETVYGRETMASSIPDDRKVIDSGTCAYDRPAAGDIDSPYELTLSGIDMSGDRYPTRTIGGTDLSAGPFYVAYYRVQVFIPFRAIDSEDGDSTNSVGSLQLTNELSDFDPDSPSGTSNFDDGFEPGYNGDLMPDGTRSNNIIGPTTYELRVRGSWAKYMRGTDNNINATSNPLVSGATGTHSGDGEIEPGQVFHSVIPFTNNGTVSMTDPQVCDSFDNTTMRLTTNDFSSGYAYVGRYNNIDGNSVPWPADWIVEYASVVYTGDNTLDGDGDGSTDYNPATGRFDGNWEAQRAIRCSDVPAGDWQTDPDDVPGGLDAVNIVRVRAVNPDVGLESGHQVRVVVPFTARDNFFGGPNDGELIPTGTVMANFGAVRSDQYSPNWSGRNYRPSPETTNGDGDRVTLTRAQIRLRKHTLTPATDVGETGSTLAGNQIVWELIPTTSASTANAEVRDITITDVLPAELTYNADCTNAQTGGTPANQVLFNTPAAGQTTLIWNLGDRIANEPIPPLIYCTDTDPLAPNGTTVTNDAEMISSNTVSALGQRSDTHTIILEQVGSIQVVKEVDLTLDDTEDEQIHTLAFGNFSANFEIAAPTLIDVLSHNGDGVAASPNFRDPGSDFSGTFGLTGPPTVTWFDGSTPGPADPFSSLGTFLYSNDAPSTISINPDADAAANTTTWCSYDVFSGAFAEVSGPGGGTCPTSFADVTAFKFISNYDLAIDGDPRQGMRITTESQATGNEPGDIYTNRFGLDSVSLPPAQFLRSNNVTVRVAAFSIGDFVFADATGDGRFEPGPDVAVPDGVPLELRRPDGTLVATTDTSVLGNGRYLFDELGSGDYIVTIPASAFQPGGVLEGWVVTPLAGNENDDLNELDDQHGVTAGSETVDGVTTGTMTLSAIPPGPGEVPIGEEPTGENSGGIADLTLDDFSNLTLDIGLVGPPGVQITKEVCSTGSSCDPAVNIGQDGWVKTTLIQFNDDATFRITVANTGYQQLVDLEVGDPLLPACDRTQTTEPGLASLAPNDLVSWTCVLPNVTERLLNTATVNGAGLLNGTVTDSDSAEIDTPPSDPAIAVVKQVNGDDANTTPGVYVGAGDSVTFTYTATNPGTVPLEDVTLVDDGGSATDPSDDTTYTYDNLVSGDTDGDERLDPGETWEFGPLAATVPAGQYTNWAVVTGDPTNGAPVVDDADPANAYGSDGGIALKKYVNTEDADTAPGIFIPEGAPVVWTFEVTNTGNVALSDIILSDDGGTPADSSDDVDLTAADLIEGDTNGDGELGLTETWVFEIAGTATAGAYENVGAVEGSMPGVDDPVSDDDPANYFGVTSGITLEKATNTIDADTPTGPVIPVGAPVTWTYTVTNDGNTVLSDVAVLDDAGTPDTADDFEAEYTSGDSNGDGLLGVDETWIFTFDDEAVSGLYGNVAAVTGTTPVTTNPDGTVTSGVDLSDDDPSHYLGSSPEIEMIKRVNGLDANSAPGPFVEEGGEAVWGYEVFNRGNVPLADVNIVDNAGTPADTSDDVTLRVADLSSGDDNGDGLLDTGETWNFVLTGVAVAGQYTNIAEVTGTAPETINPDGSVTAGVDVTDDDPANYFGSDPGVGIVKTVDGEDANIAPGPGVAVGDDVRWEYTVTNEGNSPLSNVVVADDAGTPDDSGDDATLTVADLVGGDTNGDGLLDVAETWIFRLAGVATAGQYTNIAVVTGEGPATTNPDGSGAPGTEVSDDDPANYFGSDPGVGVVKIVNEVDANDAPGPDVVVGDDVVWTYTVTNPGNVALSDVTVTDDAGTPADPSDDVTLRDLDLISGDDNGDGLLDVDETWIFTLAGVATAGQYTNVAVVTGTGPETTNPDGSAVPGADVSDDDPANYFGSEPGVGIVKTVNGEDANSAPGPDIVAGEDVAWTYAVTNEGNVVLSEVRVVDDSGTPTSAGDDITLTAADPVSGDDNGDGLLDVDETWVFELSGVATAGQYTNTAEVTGTAPDTTNADGSVTPGVDVSDDDPASYFGSEPEIMLVKAVNGQDANEAPGVYVPVGNDVTWTYTVTNAGNVALDNVTVADDAGTPGSVEFADVADDVTLTVTDLVSGDDDGDGLLDPGETWVFELSGVATAGQYTNTAEVTGTGPETTDSEGNAIPGAEVSDDDPANSFGSDPGVAVAKTVNGVDANDAPGVYVPAGEQVAWTYTVSNEGNIALADVAVVDDNGTPADAGDDTTLTVADLVSGDANGDGLLDVDETWVFELSGVATAGQYTNIAEVTAAAPETTNPDNSTTPGEEVTNDDPANSFGSEPEVAVVKTVGGQDANDAPGIFVPVGEPVTWTYTVTNPGNVALDNVAVADDAGTPDSGDDVTLTVADLVSGDDNGDGLLDPGETWVFELSGVATAGQYTNIVEVTASAPETTNPDGSVVPGVEVADDDPANSFGSDPGVAVVKMTNNVDANDAPGVYVPVGDDVVWTYTVSNEGNVALADVAVVDDNGTPADAGDDMTLTVADLVSGDENGDGLLDVDEVWVFELSGVAVAGEYINIAEVTAAAPETTNPDGSTTPGEEVTDDDPANYFGAEPGVGVAKTVNGQDANEAPGPDIVAGEDVRWEYSVTNEGNVALADVSVVDDNGTPADAGDDTTLTVADLVSGDADGDGQLDVDETWVFELAGVAITGQYTNIAEVIGTAPETTNPDGSITPGVDVTADNPANYFGGQPEIAVVKTVNGQDANEAPGIYVPADNDVTWTYTVTNPGNVALSDVTIVDDAGTPDTGEPTDAADNVTLTIADVVSGDANANGLLDVDETWIFESSGVAVAGQYTNIAEVTGTAPETTNSDGSVTPGVEVSNDDPANSFGTDPGVAVVKSANGVDANNAPGVYVPVGEPVVWTYTITNEGNVALSDIAVVDDNATPEDSADDVTLNAADLVGGDDNGDGLLNVNETWTFELTGAAVAGQYTNLAVVTGTAPETTNPDGSTTSGAEVSDDDPASSFGSEPGVAVIKTVNGQDANEAPGPDIEAGEDVRWEYDVTNEGNVALVDVSVVDDGGTPDDSTDDVTLSSVDLVDGDDNDNGLLDVDETWTFELLGVATAGQYTNFASVSGTGPETTNPDASVTRGADVSDGDPANYFGGGAGVAVIKAVNGEDANEAPGPNVAVGEDIRWEYTVSNEGSVALGDIAIVDDAGTPADPADDVTLTVADLVGGDANGDGLLDVDETWAFELVGEASSGPYRNVAVVTGTGPETVNPDGSTIPGAEVSDDDPAHHVGSRPEVAVAKAVNGEDSNEGPGIFVPVGDQITWTYTITNVGTVAIGDVVVVDDNGTADDASDDVTLDFDDLVGGDVDADGLLDLDEAWTFELTGEAATGPYRNEAVVTGTGPETTNPDGSTTPGAEVLDDDPANHIGWTSGVEIDKFVNGEAADNSPGPLIPIGETVSWTYEVRNTGSTWLTSVLVGDDQGVDVTCPTTVLAPAGAEDGSDLMICEGEPEAAVAGQYRNVGTATGSPAVPDPAVDPDDFDPANPNHLIPVVEPVTGLAVSGPMAEDSASHFGSGPALQLVKEVCVNSSRCDVSNPDHWSDSARLANGVEPTWRIRVTNIGNVALSGVVVSDLLVASCSQTIGSMSPGETTSYTCTGGGSDAAVSNTAEVTGQTLNGTVAPAAADVDTAEVTRPAPPALAFTGGSTGLLVAFALALTCAGSVLLASRRRNG